MCEKIIHSFSDATILISILDLPPYTIENYWRYKNMRKIRVNVIN